MFYQDKLKLSAGMTAFWASMVLAFLFIAIFFRSIIGLAVSFGFLLAALALTPRMLRVTKDGIAISLYLGYSIRISAGNLKEVKKLPKSYVFLSQDVPLKSRWSIPGHITQKRGLAFVVTPSDPDEFVEQALQLER